MKAGQGKTKGGQFERTVGGKLSLWLSQGQRKDLICRTVGSGAQFTSAALRDKLAGHPGDLMAQDPLAYELCHQYAIECKHWRDLQIIQFMAKKGELYKAMEKVAGEGERTGKKWWLIARQNNQADLLIMERRAILSAFLTNKDAYPAYHEFFSGEVRIYYLDEFLLKIIPSEYLIPDEQLPKM